MKWRRRYKPSDLKAARKSLGWTQGDLAQMTGYSRCTVVNWETKQGFAKGIAVSHFVEAMESEGATIDCITLEYKPPLTHFEKLSAMNAITEIKRDIRCGAKTRKGNLCKCKPIEGKRRCKFHGGMSTGARTKQGIERIRQAQRLRWQKYREQRSVL